jgi:acetylornithine deacetylase/succinyl-diaminopimelate desuccinylase-like protein
MSITGAVAIARRERRRFLAELSAFVCHASVSADPAYASEVADCACWLAGHLRAIGLVDVAVIRTRRHPIVTARGPFRPGRPTVLIYGHYDVQPVTPLADWRNPPFDPMQIGDHLYGRGASDDKGQLFVHLKALECYLRASGDVPANVNLLLDGEEEIGSPNLAEHLKAHRERLASDVALASDTRMLAPDRPVLVYGLRGSLNLEVELRAGELDLHSGAFGGAFANPVQTLAGAVADLVDFDGCITVTDFYKGVRAVSVAERRALASDGPTDGAMRRDGRGAVPWGERSYSLYERTTIRPSLTVSGISGGYEGTGVRAAIPAAAVAKLNLRLVPDQRPEHVARLVADHLGHAGFGSMRTTVRILGMASPALTDRTSPAMALAAEAYRRSFGRQPAFLRSGGTIPAVALLQQHLGLDPVLMGFALPDDAMHAPNERFYIPNLWRGIETSINFLQLVGKQLQRPRGTSVAAPQGSTR